MTQCTSLPFSCVRPFKAAVYSTSIFQQLDWGCLKDENEEYCPKKREREKKEFTVVSSPLRLQRGHTQWARRRSWSLSDPFPPCSGSQLRWTGQLPSTAEPYQQSPAFPWKTCRHCDWSASSHWKTFMEKVEHFSKVQHFPENMHCGYKSRNLWLVSFQSLKKLSQQRPAFFWKHALWVQVKEFVTGQLPVTKKTFSAKASIFLKTCIVGTSQGICDWSASSH